MVLVASLVLTIKASNDPTHDESVGENPTGRAAVHGHPKLAAGSSSYRQAPPPNPYKPSKYNSEDETPLMSSEAASEEHPMPPVMTEDNAMMLSEELTNAPESNEAMIKEVSEHDEIISVHQFKEVLDEVVNDAVDKIAMTIAGIVGKLKTAKQNLIDQDGEATSRDPQQHITEHITTHIRITNNCSLCPCQCDKETFDEFGRGNCNSDVNGGLWCFLAIDEETGGKSFCMDQKPSLMLEGRLWSRQACSLREQMSQLQEQ